MRVKLLLCLLVLLQAFGVQSQEFLWATSVSGPEYQYGRKSIQDPAGNIYLIGFSTGPSITYNSVSYPSNGDGDAYFAKLNVNKELVWMKSIGGDDSIYCDSAFDIHIDPFGDLYLTLESAGNNFTYDGQILSGMNSPGQYGGEGVLLKVSSNGDYIWHDSGSVSSNFSAVTTDAQGNVYLTGHFDSTITLGGSITLTNPSEDTTYDLLVAKYQSNGTILWAKHAGGIPHNTFAYGRDIEIHPQTNEIIVLGKGDGAVFFDGVPMPLFNGSNEGTVLISYDPDGTQNWVKRILDVQINAITNESALDISDSGIIGVCGQTYSKGLIGFYTSNGSVISQHGHPLGNSGSLASICFNEYNEAFILGRTSQGAVLGISPGTASLGSACSFIVKMDIFQQVNWVKDFIATSPNSLEYYNGKILYAGRIDAPFTYNSGQNIITNQAGDALFAELTDYGHSANRCNITGTIFQDLDANCTLDPDDVVQKSIIVKATDAGGVSRFSISDLSGHYDIPVETGSYVVEIFPNPVQSSLIAQSCFTQQDVLLTTVGEDADNVNFPLELSSCPLLNVDLSSDRRRRCFESNTYVDYSNSGFADAQNVEILVQMPEYVTFISSDHAYTIDEQGNYVFNVGVLSPNESGTIHIVDITQCVDGITGLTQCTEAWITPANDCADALDPDFVNWDKSSITVEGTCVDETLVEFAITNIALPGQGNMANPHEYRIYVDNALAVTSTFQLTGGQSIAVSYPANGQTIRLEAEQHPLHPGSSLPSETIEACGNTNGLVSHGFVNTMPMDDADVDVEIDCLEIIDSFDPNDKSVSPTGITENHFVKAGTTLEYKIRFQNTGTDTAYKVVVKDALPQYLDPSTIQFGVSSHPYLINITGAETPVLEFTFNNIDLPHSAVNEPGSHGFVKFKATTFDTLANGLQINNNAGIFFDYNYPIITNTVQNTISDMILIYNPLNVLSFLPETISVYPNPSSGIFTVEANAIKAIEVYNISGILLATTGGRTIDLSQHPKGIYFIKVITETGAGLKKVVLN